MLSSWCLTNYPIPDRQTVHGKERLEPEEAIWHTLGIHLSDDGGPSGPPRLGLCPSELLSASSPPRAPDSHRKGDYSVSLAI